ncbi:MAG: cytochrome c [Gammaproteobacteria bacterium]|nr:cytochrome c [Gammaproteobacteria bacterium]MCW9004709.1 cytochrome c [Gammaproteobacteria bacterium]MCW9056547.1 cytochrome c [Gammaproteobacteria bacterium]
MRLKTSSLFLLALLTTPVIASLPEQRQQELTHLLKHDCGSCHGMTLKGGLGPSLLPESLKAKSDELLFVTILEGRHGTPMPPWKTQLSEDDVHWIIQLLRHGPEE